MELYLERVYWTQTKCVQVIEWSECLFEDWIVVLLLRQSEEHW